jgi:hypothetical protein
MKEMIRISWPQPVQIRGNTSRTFGDLRQADCQHATPPSGWAAPPTEHSERTNTSLNPPSVRGEEKGVCRPLGNIRATQRSSEVIASWSLGSRRPLAAGEVDLTLPAARVVAKLLAAQAPPIEPSTSSEEEANKNGNRSGIPACFALSRNPDGSQLEYVRRSLNTPYWTAKPKPPSMTVIARSR